MNCLELLAPARNADIGIAAIDCVAHAVYIGGPDYGARKAAGNSIDEIARLCNYAHRFGARVFVTVNNLIFEHERKEVHKMMLDAQDAGADAFIARDASLAAWKDLTIPLHASTQCAIRDAARAKAYETLGFSRMVLERQLSLEQIKEIRDQVNCELEFFVHGALCTGYSGECYLSEHINGRSANRGDCIQACRSLYDLVDGTGKVLESDKALLSLKDYNLLGRLPELIEAGIVSFKIEGRLKNMSYVKNVVRAYSLALDKYIEKHPNTCRRASFGVIEGGFTPDVNKTFNRGYTELFLDGKRGQWSGKDAPKSVGERLGKVENLRRIDAHTCVFNLAPAGKGIVLQNGDGFSFVSGNTIKGFRGDVCNALSVKCKAVEGLSEGVILYRNINAAFEKELETQNCHRMIPAKVSLLIQNGYKAMCTISSEDGREETCSLNCGEQKAENRERMLSVIDSQLRKRSGHYIISNVDIAIGTSDESIPFLTTAFINQLRRDLIERLNNTPCKAIPLQKSDCKSAQAYEYSSLEKKPVSLMKSKYCLRYELGFCPTYQGARQAEDLFLVNNGRKFILRFDCKHCEMIVEKEV